VKPARARPRRKASVDDSAEFERLAARWNGERYTLRLYVIGMSPISSLAIRCLRAVCEERLKGRYDLEVIDVHQQPELAHEAQLIATPTVVKSSPLPVRRLVGDMTNTLRVLAGLDLPLEATGS
jgi:circadian clock protein KaiB